MRFFSRSAVRHGLATGRWQRPHRGVILTTAARGLTRAQRQWVAVLAAPGALLGGRSALELLGLRGFLPSVVDVVLPPGRKFDRPPAWVRVHRTRRLLAEDVHCAGQPVRTSAARSVVDAARWAAGAGEARTVISMAFQQRLVAGWEVNAVLRRLPTVPRARLIAQTTADACAGAHSLAELDFLALSRRAGFPEPKLQAIRRDAAFRPTPARPTPGPAAPRPPRAATNLQPPTAAMSTLGWIPARTGRPRGGSTIRFLRRRGRCRRRHSVMRIERFPAIPGGDPMRRLAPVFTLFFLAPFVAEYLMGEMPIVLLPLIVALAPMYGGGALLIRELTRRSGRGWPTMLVLGLAFGVLEEGLLTQSLFNPDYAGEHLLKFGYIAALGIGTVWSIYVLGLHVLWSISTPIVLVEEATGERRHEPWLRRTGLAATAALFLAGCLVTFAISYGTSNHFTAKPAQLIGSVAVAAVLVAVAFLLPPAGRTVRPGGFVPRPWALSGIAAVAGALFMTVTFLPVAAGVPTSLAALAGLAVLVSRWSARPGWGTRHRFALAGAALFTDAWHAFTVGADTHGATLVLNMLSHVIFAVAALVLAWRFDRAIRRHETGSAPAGSALADLHLAAAG
jgi:hypothetical protein